MAGERPYFIQRRTVVAETPRLRVAEMTLGPGEHVPLHKHSRASDVFYCLAGRLRLVAGQPGERDGEEAVLAPGESFSVAAGRPHMAVNDGADTCRYLLVQHGETIDYVPLGENEEA
ncbi:Cupin 2 conserved barrel domain protein [Desulfovibrio sp. X2]|uniref:cupin domain-containing protein n=1 Tax=Desulfovibrio sp. X2 TaxID=941449 RepID=UPI000358B551|nr:cupin domain-containing protein [Desulfovibrio sp. X2]EPR38697.1 Cupin 2 conserved barrel domain protein [Desulfovibrio sp. X2]